MILTSSNPQPVYTHIMSAPSFRESLDALAHADANGDSLALAAAMKDLQAAYPDHVTSLHLGETVGA